MTYQEKLQLPEWQKKRIEILERDNHSCSLCGFNKKKRNYLFAINFEEFILNYKIQIYNVINKEVLFNFICNDDEKCELMLDNIYKYYPNSKYWDSWSCNIKLFLDDENIKLNEINKLGVAYSNIFEEGKSVMEKILNDRCLVFEWSKHLELKNIEKKIDLHVHHKLYREDKMPWQYENENLTTLCNYCHQKTHEEEVIPYYSRFGNLICNMEICDRCNGSGTLPEFNYFQNGVCFKCCGEGFDTIKSNFEN